MGEAGGAQENRACASQAWPGLAGLLQDLTGHLWPQNNLQVEAGRPALGLWAVGPLGRGKGAQAERRAGSPVFLFFLPFAFFGDLPYG